MFPGVFNTKEPLNRLLRFTDQWKNGEMPGQLRRIARICLVRNLPGKKDRSPFCHAAEQQGEALQLHAGDDLLDAALAAARPLEGHNDRMAVFHQHQGVHTVRAVIRADGLQYAHQ